MRRKEREVSDKDAIERIIMKSDVCRIALANDNIPYIVTMNFGYCPGPDPILYFHCANAGKKLEMIRRNNKVCFEMDTDHELYNGEKGCDWGMKYSSIIGYGEIFFVTEEEEKKEGLDCIMNHYGGEGNYLYDDNTIGRTIILRLDIKEIKGKIC
jgi:nitroimidazol reductase NimA-like FMN-containing flavoprotein (pyridoxamine 5'-phosphate oxidase superfamily)